MTPLIIYGGISGNRLRKKEEKQANGGGRPASGAEALSHFEAFTARLKSCPVTRLKCERVFRGLLNQRDKTPRIFVESRDAPAQNLVVPSVHPEPPHHH